MLPFRERRCEGCVQGSELHVLPQKGLLPGFQRIRVAEAPVLDALDVAEVLENGLGVEQMLINLIEIAQRNPAPRHERFEGARSAVCGGGQFFPQAVQQRQAFHPVEGNPRSVVLDGHAEGVDGGQPSGTVHQGRITPFKFAHRPLAGQDDQAPFRVRTVDDLLSELGEKGGQRGQTAGCFSPSI